MKISISNMMTHGLIQSWCAYFQECLLETVKRLYLYQGWKFIEIQSLQDVQVIYALFQSFIVKIQFNKMYIVQSLLKWLGCTLCSLRAYFENISTGEHSIAHLIQSINSKWQNLIGQLTNSGQNCVLAKRNSTVDVLAMDVCKNRPGSKSATQSNHSTVNSCFLVDDIYK